MHTHTHTDIRILFNLKNEEILPFVTIYINLKGIILSETSHMEKDKHSMISVICGVFREEKKKKKRSDLGLPEHGDGNGRR